MFSLREKIILSAIIFNSVNFFIAWYFVGYWISEVYKDNPNAALWLFVNVILTNGLLSSTYNLMSRLMSDELSDSEGTHNYYFIHRQTFRRPRPSPSSRSGSPKEV